MADHHCGDAVCGRVHLRTARAACGLRSLVGWIPLRHGSDRQQDADCLPFLYGGAGHDEVEVQ